MLPFLFSCYWYCCCCCVQAVRVGVHTNVMLPFLFPCYWCCCCCCCCCVQAVRGGVHTNVAVFVFLLLVLLLLLCSGRSCWCTYQCNVAVFVFVLVLILVLILMFLLCCSGGSLFLFVSKLHLLFCDILMQHVDHASLEPEAFSLTNECKAKRRIRSFERADPIRSRLWGITVIIWLRNLNNGFWLDRHVQRTYRVRPVVLAFRSCARVGFVDCLGSWVVLRTAVLWVFSFFIWVICTSYIFVLFFSLF